MGQKVAKIWHMKIDATLVNYNYLSGTIAICKAHQNGVLLQTVVLGLQRSERNKIQRFYSSYL